MKLSIIIVSFNTCDLLRRCLISIDEAVGDFSIEVIVIDNNSQDGSRQMVEKEFPKINLMVNKENVGFARAVNKGLAIAKGNSVLLLNSDTKLMKMSLKGLLEFEEKVRPAIVGMKMVNRDGSIQPSVFHLPTFKGAFNEYWLGIKGSFSKYTPSGEEPSEVEAVSGGAMMISKAVVEKIGMFDERYFMYFEDLDFCRRAGASGIKIYYLPSAEVVHAHGASGRALVSSENQWRRLVPSSKVYNGVIRHYLINLIIWSGQKFHRLVWESRK